MRAEYKINSSSGKKKVLFEKDGCGKFTEPRTK